MRTGYVYHFLPDATPQYIPKLFITDVPPDVSADQLRGQLLAHYAAEPTERWAGHIVDIGLPKSPTEVQQAWASGTVETIRYTQLNALTGEEPPAQPQGYRSLFDGNGEPTGLKR